MHILLIFSFNTCSKVNWNSYPDQCYNIFALYPQKFHCGSVIIHKRPGTMYSHWSEIWDLVAESGLQELGQLAGYYFSSRNSMGISVCNCDKAGSSNNLDLDDQANRRKCQLSCDRRYRLHFVFPMLLSTMWDCEITYKWQACICKHKYEGIALEKLENQEPEHLFTWSLSFPPPFNNSSWAGANHRHQYAKNGIFYCGLLAVDSRDLDKQAAASVISVNIDMVNTNTHYLNSQVSHPLRDQPGSKTYKDRSSTISEYLLISTRYQSTTNDSRCAVNDRCPDKIATCLGR